MSNAKITVNTVATDIQKTARKRVQDAENAGLLKPSKTVNMGSIILPGKIHKVVISGVIKL